MHRTHNKHFHFFLISHLPAYLKRRSLVAAPPLHTPTHPCLMRKQLRRVLCPQSQRPGAVRSSDGRKEKTQQKNPKHTGCLSTCLQLCICFSLRFASLPSNLFSPSPWLQTLSPSLSLSPSSLQPPSFRSSHLGALGCSGFRRITLTMVDQYRY